MADAVRLTKCFELPGHETLSIVCDNSVGNTPIGERNAYYALEMLQHTYRSSPNPISCAAGCEADADRVAGVPPHTLLFTVWGGCTGTQLKRIQKAINFGARIVADLAYRDTRPTLAPGRRTCDERDVQILYLI